LTETAGYIPRVRDGFICLQTVTYPSTNWARRKTTSLIGHNALPLRHAIVPTKLRLNWYRTAK